MKVAVPTRGQVVDDHFGHCEVYTVFTIDDQGSVVNRELLPSPQGCGCKSNIASILRDMGVTVMLAGNMGDGALMMLFRHGIEVYRGCTGDVNQVVADFIGGGVQDSGQGCHHHGNHDHGHGHAHGHQCNH